MYANRKLKRRQRQTIRSDAEPLLMTLGGCMTSSLTQQETTSQINELVAEFSAISHPCAIPGKRLINAVWRKALVFILYSLGGAQILKKHGMAGHCTTAWHCSTAWHDTAVSIPVRVIDISCFYFYFVLFLFFLMPFFLCNTSNTLQAHIVT